MFFVFFSMNLYVRGYHLYERVGLVGKALNTIEIFHNICLKGINGVPKISLIWNFCFILFDK